MYNILLILHIVRPSHAGFCRALREGSVSPVHHPKDRLVSREIVMSLLIALGLCIVLAVVAVVAVIVTACRRKLDAAVRRINAVFYHRSIAPAACKHARIGGISARELAQLRTDYELVKANFASTTLTVECQLWVEETIAG